MKITLYVLFALSFCGNVYAQETPSVSFDEMLSEILQFNQRIEGLEKSNSSISGTIVKQDTTLTNLESYLITGEKSEKQIQELLKSVMEEISDLEQSIIAINQSIKTQDQKLQTLEDCIKNDHASLQESDISLNTNVESLKNLGENNRREIQGSIVALRSVHDELALFQKNSTDNFQELGKQTADNFKIVTQGIHKWTYYSLIVVSLLTLITLGLFIVLWRKFSNSVETLNNSIKTKSAMRSDVLSLDTKLTILLAASLADATKTGADSPTRNEIDHTLPLRIGEEIHRMRKRIAHMPEGTTGLGALNNSLIRLEDEFNAHDYEIVELMGKIYVDGLTVDARFVPTDDLKSGEKIITKVIKPQINYKGVLIKPAQVEVGVGG